MSGVPDEMPDIPTGDDRGKYDSVFFRVGGGISVGGAAMIAFLYYDRYPSSPSLAEIAGVADRRVEFAAIGLLVVVFGLLVAVGGPILYRELG